MSTPKRAKLGNWNEVKGGRSGEIQRDGRERKRGERITVALTSLAPRGPVAKAERLLDCRIALLAANLSGWCGEGAGICPFCWDMNTL